ncbi:hypothetical protein DH86_00000083 [Scytalidium sp. 3C]|nr:hypothetical protein DH86_00000083 [Scytalidium sp. 3C]
MNSLTMAENVPPAGANGDVPGQPFYEKTRQHLKELLHKRRILERSLAAQEDAIYKKETEYLEETPSGNIITGFESYTKGTSSTAPNGARRKGGITASSQSTPVVAAAATPLSTSFLKGESGSNHATPTSATSGNRTGAGNKKNKKGGDDSETEGRDTKKVRTNFGASRK